MSLFNLFQKKRRLLLLLLTPILLFLAAAGLLVICGKNDQLGQADVALVLGNKVNPDGSPSPRLKARLDTAVTNYQKGYFPKIIVSGGTGIEGVPEGTAMKSYLISAGVPDEAIIVDNQGVDTKASAQSTLVLLNSNQTKSVFVITQYFHIPRTKLALKKTRYLRALQRSPTLLRTARPLLHHQRNPRLH